MNERETEFRPLQEMKQQLCGAQLVHMLFFFFAGHIILSLIYMFGLALAGSRSLHMVALEGCLACRLRGFIVQPRRGIGR